MAEKYLSLKNEFTKVLEKNCSDGLKRFKENSWDNFLKQGFPTKRKGNELWKYTNLSFLDKNTFKKAKSGATAPPKDIKNIRESGLYLSDCYNLVLLNGEFLSELSTLPKGGEVSVVKFGDSGFDRSFFGDTSKQIDDSFLAFNGAFCDGVLVELKPNVDLDKPVQVLSLISTSEDLSFACPRVYFRVGEKSSCSFFETHLNLTHNNDLYVPVVECSLGKSASMRHCRLQFENSKGTHIGYVRVDQDEGSRFRSTSYARGAGIGRYDIHTLLNGEGAECNLHGVYLTKGDEHQSNEISTTHAKPKAVSHQFFKGVLSGNSRAVFSGKVLVKEGAQKSEADQKDLNLLLSDKAEIDTKPSLEIYADDVMCGHGATAGHLDQNTLFYMLTRGVEKGLAMELLARGFVGEIVDEIEHSGMRNYLASDVEKTVTALLLDAN